MIAILYYISVYNLYKKCKVDKNHKKFTKITKSYGGGDTINERKLRKRQSKF